MSRTSQRTLRTYIAWGSVRRFWWWILGHFFSLNKTSRWRHDWRALWKLLSDRSGHRIGYIQCQFSKAIRRPWKINNDRWDKVESNPRTYFVNPFCLGLDLPKSHQCRSGSFLMHARQLTEFVYLQILLVLAVTEYHYLELSKGTMKDFTERMRVEILWKCLLGERLRWLQSLNT